MWTRHLQSLVCGFVCAMPLDYLKLCLGKLGWIPGSRLSRQGTSPKSKKNAIGLNLGLGDLS